ncbi:SMC family ATPase [Rhodococcus sp. HNM0569]|uniref:AAA family ATPase n=1 Tax=Rhodococcus sp. HNM0569 TaxID=2716340 RepID=UPI00146C43EE|nr:SMC family ATPase [Rhodococcus sp. HNM0569]NLU83793.1 SMC family ATPase [Rhodococcus sp. HNM0569]
MRLHHLRVQAFGPFGREVDVDFDALGADGLFLLHGQTGAGKTTILDAVAFALYGTVPGARREGKRLLSDHAAPGSVPKVRLEATLGGRRVRIERSPEYTRPKLRGSGTVVENAKATLEWLDGSGEPLSRIPEIGAEIGRLLGMSADQFFQVVLLPQGEFARFLRADNDERGALLERLFDTSRFGDVETWFVERRRESGRALEAAERDVDLLVARIAAVAGLDAGTDEDPSTWAGRLVEDATDAQSAANLDLETARGHATRARGALEHAQRIADAQHRAAQARRSLAELDADADRVRAAEAEADAARRAAPIHAADRELRAAEAAVADTELARTAVTAALEADPDGRAVAASLTWPPREADRAALRDAVRAWSDEVVRLDVLVDDARRAQGLARELDTLGQRRTALASAEAECRRRAELLPGEIAEADAARAAAQRADGEVAAARHEHERAVDALDASREWQRAQARRTDVRAAHVEAREAQQSAYARVLELRGRRLAGMAAELAAGLETGQACVVCGATEHPRVAEPADDAVTKADEEAAAEAHTAATAEVERVAGELAALDRTLDVLAQRGGDADPDALAAAEADTRSRFESVGSSAATLAAREQALTALRAEDTELRTRLADLDVEAASLREKTAAITAELDATRARVDAAAGDDASVSVRRDRLARLAEAGGRLAEARDEGARAEARVREAVERRDTVARDAGFGDAAEASAAVRPDDRVAQLESAVAQARDARAAARAVLDDPHVRTAEEADPVDVAAARTSADAATAASDAALTRASEAERRLADLERYLSRLHAALDALAPIRAGHDELAGLADVVAGRGQNARRMSLRSYVLAARLEEVALSASVRLRRMSGGRYEFVHTDEAGPRGKRGGLGLDVRDDFTGAVRSAKTLSGGESFLASLSLALGLADVVAAESGGVVLDTMFIDEGFGTLDAETLDEVMGVLDELRDGGRVVGIVSHVDEMRQRIPSRLHVVRGRTGSVLEMTAG